MGYIQSSVLDRARPRGSEQQRAAAGARSHSSTADSLTLGSNIHHKLLPARPAAADLDLHRVQEGDTLETCGAHGFSSEKYRRQSHVA
uniref:Uncharacterized protein n=1 Tax=Knipowitschia caucasica TaxID=637954 RepID=A0AAV2KTD7_KNICA